MRGWADFIQPPPPSNVGYEVGGFAPINKELQVTQQNFELGQSAILEWWQLFQSDALNAVVEKSINNNENLKASEARLLQSQDLLRAGYGIFFPHIGLSIGASRQLISPALLGQSNQGSIFNLTTASANVSYTLDVFGGERRQVEALKAQVDLQRHIHAATYLMLSSNIVNTSIARTAYQQVIRQTEELIVLEKEQLKLAHAQVTGGVKTYSTILFLLEDISKNEALLAPLRQKLSQADHLLASLEGVDPSHVMIPKFSLEDLSLPLDMPVSLPSDLVRQRPDILSAQAQLHIASANIGVATANMFPSITLGAGFGIASNSFANLSSPNQEFWSIGPSINIPIFQGGSLFYGRQAAKDFFKFSQASYRQVVLDAFSQVADCLTAIEHNAQLFDANTNLKKSSMEVLRLAKINYQAGLINYSDVLSADIQLHHAQIDYLQSLANRYQDSVALYVAIGGGLSDSQWH